MWEHILQQVFATTPLEWMAFVFGLTQVVLARLNLRLNFVAGLLSVLGYTVVFMQAHLYAESLLNAYYTVISVWGWWHWSRSEEQEVAIYGFKRADWVKSSVLTMLLLAILYAWLSCLTDSTLPLWDAVVTAFAWVGSLYLVYRKLENWLFLTVSNLVAIPVQWSKGLELTALLSVLFLVMGLMGYFRWRKVLKATQHIT